MPWSNEWDDALWTDGYQIGQYWQRHTARRGELRRLRRFYEQLQPLDWDTWWLCAGANTSEVFSIMAAIDPHSEHDPQAAREFWQQIVGRADTDVWESEFALGFVEGALGLEPSAQFDANDEADEAADEQRVSASERHLTETGPPPGVEEFGKALRGLMMEPTGPVRD